jgi:hypothetical protein
VHTALLLLTSVSAFGATTKLRPLGPADGSSGAPSIALAAARNEFESFQVMVSGGARNVRMRAELAGFPAATLWLYREGLLNITTPSTSAGAVGAWPDPLIPDRDEIYGETRNAFPFDVPAGESRAVWVDLLVPPDQPAGHYTGAIHVTADGFATDVPFTVEVYGFTLPSTPSLRSAFLSGWADACIAHYGHPCDDAGTVRMHQLYGAFALDHRLTLADIVYTGPAAAASGYDWASWDALYRPYLDGGAPTRLAGAHLTSVEFVWTRTADHFAAWARHFRERGWFERTFDYTCDEPPVGCAFGDIAGLAATAHAGDPAFRTLVTTSLAQAQQNGIANIVDVLAPVVDGIDSGAPHADHSSEYDAWASARVGREVWWYLSCEPASSCRDGVVMPGQIWPSYIVDAPGIQNRIMGWLAFRYGLTTELYYDTTYMFSHGDPWQSLYKNGNNGDGTLFYPGTPARIGGSHDIPLASIRLKLIREGREDYEYLARLVALGDAAGAHALAMAVAPTSFGFTTDPVRLEAARREAARRILALQDQRDPGPSSVPGRSGGTTSAGGGNAGLGGAAEGAPGGGTADRAGACSAGGHGGRSLPGWLLLALAVVLSLWRRRR